MKRVLWVSMAFLSMCSGVLHAAEAEPTPKKEAASKSEELKEEFSVTHHTVTIDGKPLHYTATAGNLVLKSADGKPEASIFFIAYTKDDEKEPAKRPVTFVTNGGPGSSSVWLHLGLLGPRRVSLNADGTTQAPYQLVDNEYSALDLTDLVFIDPVSSGFSRAAPGVDPKQFHSVDEDVKCLSEFIRLYITRYHRWDAPKFFAGESYGTTRGAALAAHLHDEEHIYLSGLIMISTVLNFQNIVFDMGSDIPFILIAPTYTAAAWYHKKLSPELQRKELLPLLKEVETFALGPYASSLMKGDRLSKSERAATVQQLARYTGLSPEFIERQNLRVTFSRFAKELLRNQKRVLGRFDCTYTGIDNNSCGESYEFDPSADVVFGVFTASINHYLEKDLQVQKDEKYDVLANVWPWNFSTNSYLNVSSQLRDVMSRNPKMQVFVGSGIYDMATPYLTADYAFDHVGLDPSLKSNITMRNYIGGHMMYIHIPSLKQMKEDFTAFYKKVAS